MTDKEFDKFISSKLNHFETPVSPNLWDKINAENQKRRRILPWWQSTAYLYPIAAAAVLAVVVTALWLTSTPKSLPTHNNTTATPTQKQANLPTPNNTTSTTTPTVKSELANAEKASSIDSATHSSLVKSKHTSIQSPSLPLTIQQSKNNPHQTSKLAPQQKTKQQLMNEVSNLSPKHEEKTSKPLLNSPTAIFSSITDDNNLWVALGKQSIVSMYGHLPKQVNAVSLKYHAAPIQNKLACPNRPPKNVFADFYVSPNIALQQVHSTGATAAYLRLKDSSEKMLTGFSVGARLTQAFGKKWSLSAGLQYTQSNQQFVQKTENERKTTVVLVTRSITDELGITTTFLDTTTVTEIGYRTKSFINQFKSIEIPITASYCFGNDYWQFGLHAGTVLGIINTYSGSTYDNNRNLISLTNGSVFRSQIQLGLIGGLGIYRKLNYQTTVFAEPHFRYALTSNQSNTLNYQQKFHLTGITAGIRLQLNNLSKSSISLQ